MINSMFIPLGNLEVTNCDLKIARRKMEPHTEKLLRLMILVSMGPFRDYEEIKNLGLTNKIETAKHLED